MDFNLPAEDDPRRVEVRKWFEANPNPTYAQMAKQGYVVPHWPAPWGLSAEPELQLIIDQEIERAGIVHPMKVNSIAVNQCGQSLLTHGTEEQRQKFLPSALACEAKWCMLFSEPSGGSDLGAIRTTARKDGDHYVINGQKTWNSVANKAKVGVLIARTDPSVPKHKGMSVFLIDMKTPGVEVTPIVDMTGEEPEYNEVFLSDVRVPADRLLGREGDGWRIVLEQLQTERMGMTKPGAVWGFGPTARELMTGLMETGKIKDPLVRDEAAKLYVEGELLRLLTYRNLSNRINGKPAGLEANVGQDAGVTARTTAVGPRQTNARPRRNDPKTGRIAVAEGQLRALQQLGLFLLVRPCRDARRRYSGDPQKRGVRADAGFASRRRSDRQSALRREWAHTAQSSELRIRSIRA